MTKKYTIIEAGNRAMLKTTKNGLLVCDKKTNRVLLFNIKSNDLYKLAESLYRREKNEKE